MIRILHVTSKLNLSGSSFEAIVALHDQHAVFDVGRQMRFHETQEAARLEPETSAESRLAA
jgi:hypothetical protein